ncbi:hypothetical protein [Parerythrobacter aestuarii]|uniref:hypothetical protein n=1 Tax=Parerythrobacter aestuarii TaxID=3020909 RepID=UPI0024DE2C85|nr:hypothetical protein [Parerythrobacter aestuarii]
MRLMLTLSSLLVLAACSSEPEEVPVVPERDPATTQALSDQIMVDPDLTQQNEANAALTGGTDHSLPPIVATREAIEDAKLEAADLVGGSSQLKPLGKTSEQGDPLPEGALYSVTEMAKLTPGTSACADSASFTAMWAAKMPKAFPVYPRGNTIEAAGSDTDPCSLRAIRFLTPVSTEDVLAFYTASARKEGYSTSHLLRGEIEELRGAKGKGSYAVYVRRRASGISDVGLVTSGVD